MKLLRYFAIALACSTPASAIYYGSAMACNNVVEAQAYTGLDFDDMYWYGLTQTYAQITINGPVSSFNYGYGFEFSTAWAYPYVNAVPGTYLAYADHFVYSAYYGWSYVAAGTGASCNVQGSGSSDPTPQISQVSPNQWDAGNNNAGHDFGKRLWREWAAEHHRTRREFLQRDVPYGYHYQCQRVD
jgi:hypothetical protein